ncbi:alpha/beta hydrolase [Paraburkholderia sp. J67]|uniref:alpha/beta fold hydrolase n=1 Tax=Paraburkholderia sp. J67 TaxID=2805435 RepID=UPI002ABEA255|nr:alpha/beta hydrolase [Paraburkholderia sp. J67]
MYGDAPTLFLHGGPGGSAAFERAHYGRSLPIHWWDQPRSVVLYPSPFSALVGAAQAEVRLLAQRGSGPVDVVAHAFGATLALALAERMPDVLGTIVLLAPIHDVGAACVRFAMSLNMSADDAMHLTTALAAFQERPELARLRVLVDEIERVLALPFMAPVQWCHDPRMSRRSAFDRDVFDAVIGDAWSRALPATVPHVAQRVRVVVGAADPMLDIDAERRRRATLCPAARFRVVPCGHFIHLTAPPSVWWPPFLRA